MKCYFIVDTTCGGGKKIEKFFYQIPKIKEKYQEEAQIIRITEANLITPICSKLSNSITTKTLVICCGGDSSLNSVINGLKDNPNVIFSIYPMGISNDFLASFSKEYDFNNINKIIKGKDILIDLLNVNGKYSYNVTNIGFDAQINHEMESLLKSRKFSYAFHHAILKNLLSYKSQKLRIICDDKLIYEGPVLLSAFGNGVCYGAGYYCTPKADISDGLIDICIIKRVSIFQRITAINKYKKGLLFNSKNKKIISLQAKHIEITSIDGDNFYVCLDGKDFSSNHLDIINENQVINFRIPNFHK